MFEKFDRLDSTCAVRGSLPSKTVFQRSRNFVANDIFLSYFTHRLLYSGDSLSTVVDMNAHVFRCAEKLRAHPAVR